MLLWGPPVNQDIIYEYHHFEDPIHKVHECCRGVTEAKGHHHEFIVSVVGAEGSLGYILISDSELMVPQMKVYFRKGPHAP